MVQRIFQNLIILSIALTCAQAEISLSIAQTSGRYLQYISDDSGSRVKQSILAGRPAFFFEFDSKNSPLFLSNDNVVFGVGAMAETRFHDYVRTEDNATYIPLYANYYLNYGEYSFGLGLNVSMLELRRKNDTARVAQQLGKQFMIRRSFSPETFLEIGLIQSIQKADYVENETTTLYDTTHYVFKWGWYLDNNNL